MELNVTEITEDFAHLAHVHSARPRFQNPAQLTKMKMGEGMAFDIDSMELEDGLEEDEEEVYDDDVLAMFSFGDVSEKEKMTTNTDLFDVEKSAHRDFPGTEKLMTPLNKEGTVIRQGSELQVPERSKLYFHYASICEGDDEVFDTTMSRKYPNVMDLRKETTIPGLALAVKSMCLSEVSRFIIYPEMAFGKAGCPPRILPDAKVMYVIQMLQFVEEAKLNTLHYMTSDERNQLPFEQIVKVAKDFRGEGNRHYQDQNHGSAIKKWRKALNMLEDYPVTTEEDDKVRREYVWMLYSNLAQSYLKLERPAQACSACKIGLKSAVENDFSSAKLLYRFAKAKLMLKDHDAALGLINQALKIEPKDRESIELKSQIVLESGRGMEMFKGIFKSNGKTTNGMSKGTQVQAVVKTYNNPDSEAKVNRRLKNLRSGYDLDDWVEDLAFCTASQKELVEMDAEKAVAGSKRSTSRIKPVLLSKFHLSTIFKSIDEELKSAESGNLK
ncbi:Inactive peptidyl-prolyl cis-trans isomerase FKBP6 [Orchesella cincta]|uniref:peptidylprolyl isomerase n=1 Tax=Orchesella cincta TaxID=48709 RepID=A0A1D2NKH0_ORCCI|nr:Inactive peptidyl-prolyl cis-trans isomerase FKBP6 [Orchesella cincta]